MIFILIITGLAKVSSADRTIDGSEELPKSLHFIDHTLNSDLVYLWITSHEKNCSFAFILMIISTQYEIVHPLNDSLYGKNICVIKLALRVFLFFLLLFFSASFSYSKYWWSAKPISNGGWILPEVPSRNAPEMGRYRTLEKSLQKNASTTTKIWRLVILPLVTHIIANSGVQLARLRTVQSYKLLALFFSSLTL